MRKREKGVRGEGKRQRKQGTSRTQTHTNIKYPSALNDVCAQNSLLHSHGSESNILLHRYRSPALSAVRKEHQPEHTVWMTTLIRSCYCPTLYPPCHVGQISCARCTPLVHIIYPAYLSFTEIPAVDHSTANQSQQWAALSALSLSIQLHHCLFYKQNE